MERTMEADAERRIESLTANLLECFEELDLIYRLSRGLKSTLDARTSAEMVLSEAIEIFEADVGWMSPADPATSVFGSLITQAAPETVERFQTAMVGELVRGGRSRICYSVATELGIRGPGHPETLMCATMKTEGVAYGALCVGRVGPGRPFTARDLKLGEVLASQAAIAIENSILHKSRVEEEQARVRIEEEMRLARQIQSNLLPPAPPALPGYDIACRSVPALSVGGDYYDFIPIEGGRMALCVADVSGKGIPAAMLMANLQATIRSQTLAGVSPADCARRSNRLLHRSMDIGRFATCFYGVLDLESGRLEYSNAGHDHPLVLGSSGEETSLIAGGPVLGAFDDQRYDQGTVTLERGQVLVAYSDGITESFDARGRAFGIAGLRQVLARCRDGCAREILEEILAAATAHAGSLPQADDMTLVVVRRL
jgi:sigma-B regulation protein RsbU (phosphoserine phosphatase)